MVIRLHKDEISDLIAQAGAQILQDVSDAGHASPEIVSAVLENLDWLNTEIMYAHRRRLAEKSVDKWYENETEKS